MSPRAWAIVVISVLAGTAAGGTGATPTVFPGKSGRIAYNAAAAGKNAWISTVSPDGSRIRRLRLPHGEAFSPSWSADGRRIAFVLGPSIWRVNGDGHAPRRVTPNKVVDPQSPAWSPTGDRLVFTARTSGRNFDIYVIGARGGGLRRLTRSPGSDEHPSWSPDSRRIVYTRTALNGTHVPRAELWTMNVDGSHQRRIGFGSAPDWAPDGKRLAFSRGAEVWVANTNGTKAERVVAGPGMAGDPAWSPDGRWIVFWSDRASGEATKGDLYLTAPGGEGVKRLTYEPELWHFAPSWQPLNGRAG